MDKVDIPARGARRRSGWAGGARLGQRVGVSLETSTVATGQVCVDRAF